MAVTEYNGEEVIPGTEVLLQGQDGSISNPDELVLIPHPSNNPDDPLVSFNVNIRSCLATDSFDHRIGARRGK